jgi:hydrogenase expression/formation protein HypE
MNHPTEDFILSCPIPIEDYPNVLLAHGGGGRLTQQLIEKMFLRAFDNPSLSERHDGAVVPVEKGRMAFTTDSFVVRPLFFPGGDIGSLAVNGTVNDLAMCGARPLCLSVGFILEEGLPMETLWRVVQSMGKAAKEAGVRIVTGDTKVVDLGKGDGIFINTAGIGFMEHSQPIGPAAVREEDRIILSGAIGRHGIAVMAVREGLEFQGAIESDSAPLTGPVMRLLSAGVEVHCLRDLTRGGLATALNEIAGAAGTGIRIDEALVPVDEEVRGACEILGLDPLYVANEGRFIAFVPESEAERALGLLRSDPLGAGACRIGEVGRRLDRFTIPVVLKSRIGATRVLDMLSGEQLPRIC